MPRSSYPDSAIIDRMTGRSVVRLHDSARRGIVPLEPGPLVTLYSCGITPYDSAHLGHAQVYLTFDILRKARELGVHYLDLAAEEITRFDRDMDALGLLPAWSEPRATSAIAEIAQPSLQDV